MSEAAASKWLATSIVVFERKAEHFYTNYGSSACFPRMLLEIDKWIACHPHHENIGIFKIEVSRRTSFCVLLVSWYSSTRMYWNALGSERKLLFLKFFGPQKAPYLHNRSGQPFEVFPGTSNIWKSSLFWSLSSGRGEASFKADFKRESCFLSLRSGV